MGPYDHPPQQKKNTLILRISMMPLSLKAGEKENPGCSRTKSKLRKGFTKAPDHLTVHLIPQLQGSTHHRRLREALSSQSHGPKCVTET